MKSRIFLCLTLLLLVTQSYLSKAQTISKEELVFLTSAWKGESLANGQPKVSDALIARAKKLA